MAIRPSGVFREEIRTCPPLGAEGALLLLSASWKEKLVSAYCALKKFLGQQKFSSKKCSQKGQQKISSVFPKTVNKNLGIGISPEKQNFHLKFGKKVCPPT